MTDKKIGGDQLIKETHDMDEKLVLLAVVEARTGTDLSTQLTEMLKKRDELHAKLSMEQKLSHLRQIARLLMGKERTVR